MTAWRCERHGVTLTMGEDGVRRYAVAAGRAPVRVDACALLLNPRGIQAGDLPGRLVLIAGDGTPLPGGCDVTEAV